MPDPRRAHDTIAAIATPPGDGGVGIIRLSGVSSRSIAARMFRPARPSFTDFTPYTLHYGRIVASDGAVLDDVLVAFMPGPGSYTGEDVVEINCHGGRAVLAAVLEETLRQGARLAERGEFTYRAFMHGRLDLTQAEAVAEMIHAPSRSALHLAQAKLSGLLGRRITELRSGLESLRARLAVAVDFPEDEVECLAPGELAGDAARIRAEIDALLGAVDRSRTWREGALVVLAGRVNAGKSSLMNALLGHDRAIVTDQPGTTRDYLEESLNLDGLLVRLVDTAGMRPCLADDSGHEPIDAVETAGMHMGQKLMDRADLVLLLADGTAPLDAATLETAAKLSPGRALAVLTKQDLPGFDPSIRAAPGLETVTVSSTTGHGLDALCVRIRARILENAGQPDPDELAPNARQAAALGQAAEELRLLEADAVAGVPYDLLSVRLETACATLSSITGEITSQEVLDAIFDAFCIGK
ncbi:tRNA uridine-5-carboxymethylaminomethyl(34) synthesis GTPase MnmE [Pseudodesulfovibrio sp. F-1]|uniref:tRNA modification GTPase MnmE n=1 Tax=Pseudodesulfovibrio alkaliphilus TaxID=2661613 RepID=A0A7K1KJX1_9BACT|nr:tRNA uridine-5-carboxymethylaminomethyl(34) synthesis GTPase MnmE [Pseudodesulfovibrio alkaliphilus]MUM76366.1 tRNA uridine-5-carboxymethylaminomethyl(34) synthesis GTPase MnmE [Pseudodesulfovibrio alkaliphilus]